MELTQILESLDQEIFTPDLKRVLTEQFNDAVELKSAVLTEERLDEEVARLEAKTVEYQQLLETKAEDYADYIREETLQRVTDYLDLVVEEFVQESSDSLAESIKSQKSDMLIEAFDSMLVAGGTSFQGIVESNDGALEKANETVNDLAEQLISTRKENEELIKTGLIAEMCEDLTLVQSARFKRLASLVEFTRNQSYADKLESIKESISDIKSGDLHEAAPKMEQNSGKPAWMHLV